MNRWLRLLLLGPILATALILLPGTTLASDPSLVGQWSMPVNWPAVGVHATLLNNGRVMTWGHRSAPFVNDPTPGALTQVPNPFANAVCGGANMLGDGRMVTVGGGGLAGPGI